MYPCIPNEILVNVAQLLVWFVTVAASLFGVVIATRT